VNKCHDQKLSRHEFFSENQRTFTQNNDSIVRFLTELRDDSGRIANATVIPDDPRFWIREGAWNDWVLAIDSGSIGSSEQTVNIDRSHLVFHACSDCERTGISLRNHDFQMYGRKRVHMADSSMLFVDGGSGGQRKKPSMGDDSLHFDEISR
jgi:hypothetical protein